MANKSTAILFFSRSTSAESCFKPIVGNYVDDCRLWNYLYNKTLLSASQTNLPVIVCDERMQIGNSFGEKITNALTSAFLKGYDNLIVVGSDCVDLNASLLLKVNDELNSGKTLVLGPDSRGGVYLFGINKCAFNTDVLLHLDWQTSRLYQQLASYANTFCSAIFPRLLDINTKEDLLQSFNTFSTSAKWRKLLSDILGIHTTIYAAKSQEIYVPSIRGNKPLRAPPIY